MDFETAHYEHDNAQQPQVGVPAAEIFHSPAETLSVWRQEHAADPTFLTQITQRAEYAASVNEVLDALPSPTTSLQTAAEEGHISEDQASNLYDSLSALLSDGDYARMALYLPLEFMPSAGWQPQSSQLEQSLVTFKDSYMHAWHSLLGVYDIRANFVDGDVLEQEYRKTDLARVVKAAHLIPTLLEHGMLAEDDVLQLMKTTHDSLLHMSIQEALSAYYGTELDQSVRDTAGAQVVSERRKEWLAQKQADADVVIAAKHISTAILADEATNENLKYLLNTHAEFSADKVLAEGIYSAIASVAATDEKAARELFDQYQSALIELWSYGTEHLKNHMSHTFIRLYRLGIIDKSYVDNLGIGVPNLAAPLSENLSLMAEDVTRLKRITDMMETDAELQAAVYPVVLIGGSRLKGYGGRDSDVDVSVLVRPDVPDEARAYVRELLMAAFTGNDYAYEPIEFWLDEDGNNLHVSEVDADTHMADPYWTHVLFNSAWVGDKQTITELQAKILPEYFYESDKTAYGRPARALYLERIEQDLLQYRLMHKGYERQYPLHERAEWTQSAAVDGDSVFWDSGYRQLATQLFVNQVFLPKIAKK